MNAVEVGENLLMKTGQFLGSSVVVALNRYRTQKKEFSVVGTNQIAVLIQSEIYRPVRIIPVSFVGAFVLLILESVKNVGITGFVGFITLNLLLFYYFC